MIATSKLKKVVPSLQVCQSEKNSMDIMEIWNGKLILSKDTFDIENLGADTLSLENKAGIFVFTRGNKLFAMLSLKRM